MLTKTAACNFLHAFATWIWALFVVADIVNLLDGQYLGLYYCFYLLSIYWTRGRACNDTGRLSSCYARCYGNWWRSSGCCCCWWWWRWWWWDLSVMLLSHLSQAGKNVDTAEIWIEMGPSWHEALHSELFNIYNYCQKWNHSSLRRNAFCVNR